MKFVCSNLIHNIQFLIETCKWGHKLKFVQHVSAILIVHVCVFYFISVQSSSILYSQVLVNCQFSYFSHLIRTAKITIFLLQASWFYHRTLKLDSISSSYLFKLL